MKLLILSSLLLLQLSIFSKDNLSIYFNPNINYNIHSTNFTNLKGISNYNYSNYGSYSNITPSFSIGINNKFDNSLFDLFSEYSLETAYNNNSILLNRKELLGNFIKENEFYPIYSEVPIDANISNISINNYLWLDTKLPIDIGVNLNLAYSTGSSFVQVEKALGKNEYTFENGQREREKYSGEIPEFNKFNILVGANIKYDFDINENYTISPKLSYNLALIPFVNDLEWTYSNVNFGVNIYYNLIEATVPPSIPAKDPILPDLIAPKAPKELELYFYLSAVNKGEEINNNDTVDIRYNSIKTQEKYSILPIIYFEKNSDELLHSSGNKLFELAHNSLLDNIINNLKNNHNTNLVINTGKFLNKDKSIFDKRIDKIKSLLSKDGIDISNIKVNYNEVEKLEFRYDELKVEEDKLVFSFDNSDDKLLEFTYFENTENQIAEEYKFNFKVNYSLNDDVISSINYNNNTLLFQEPTFDFKFDKNNIINLNNNILKINSSAVSIRTNTLSDSLVINFNYILNNEKLVSNKIENENKSRYILGYFKFDDSQFNGYDDNVIRIIKSALNNNKKVILIPMTDNIGDIEYNKGLARRRAIEALKLLNVESNLVNIKYDSNSFFNNDHPYGRTLNRSVIVEILD